MVESIIASIAGKNFVDGKLCESSSGELFNVVAPATLENLAAMPQSNANDVDGAVKAASQAFLSWKKTAPFERANLLRKAAVRLREHSEKIAKLMALETGKALRTESLLEAGSFADILDFYAGLALELKGETIPFDSNMMVLTVREPLGVVGAILPWNVPLMLMMLKIAPALTAGNTVVVKSAEQSPLTTLYAVSLLADILPAGVVNVLCGDYKTGQALVDHKDVHKITFTGSVESGRIVYQNAAKRLVPVTLELGGKSPMIVLKDADVEQAVQGAVNGMRFTRQGQSCSAASRIFVHESLYEMFRDQLLQALDKLVIGDPLDLKTDVGSLISQEQYDKVQGFLKEAQSLSHITLHQCSTLPKAPHLKGHFLQPTIVEGAKPSDSIAANEIFGPVTCLFSYQNVDDALTLANDTDFGLAATVWGRDIKTILPLVNQLEAGFVQVNQNLVVKAGLSYGGFKNSGLGKEASLEAMLEHFTRKKTILMNMN